MIILYLTQEIHFHSILKVHILSMKKTETTKFLNCQKD
jgi:hypothetical protein